MNKDGLLLLFKINAIKISMIFVCVLIIGKYLFSNGEAENGGGREILIGVCNQNISTEEGRQAYLNCIKTLQNEADNKAVMNTTSPDLSLEST